MSHPGIVFDGDWTERERERVEHVVSAIDRFLQAHMPSPWSFRKQEGVYSAEQPSLILSPIIRDRLGMVIVALKRVAEETAPWVTYGE